MKVDEARAIERLNRLVTGAIIVAEHAHGERARELYAEVARYEAAVAALTQPDSIEGCIARRGVVTAHLSAGRPKEAVRWARHLAQEPGAPAELLEQLEGLAIEAHGVTGEKKA